MNLDLIIEHCNYNFKITLLPFLDLIDHKTWFIDKNRSFVGIDPTGNDVIDIILGYLSLNTNKISACAK